MWRNADWARKRGLFAELHADINGVDESVHRLAETLAHSNPDAMNEMKKIFWNGTEHWDKLLIEYAKAVSGRLMFISHSKKATVLKKR